MHRNFLAALLGLMLLVGSPTYAAIRGSLLTSGGIVPSSGVVVGDVAMLPFVNLMKFAQTGFLDQGTTFLYPTNLNANQFPTGTISNNYNYSLPMPDNYFGKYVISVTGAVSGTTPFQFVPPFGVNIDATTGSPTIGGCNGASTPNVPPCFAQNGVGFSGSNFTITFDLGTGVSNVQNNGSGLIQLVNPWPQDILNGTVVTVNGLVGSDGNGCGANGVWTVANRTNTTIDLQGSSFPVGCTYVSGGGIYPNLNTKSFNPLFIRFAAGTYSVTNVSICKLADYSADNTCNTTAGKTAWPGGFNDDFVQKLAALKPKYIRFLDYNNWTFGPAQPAYADLAQETWMSYATQGWTPSKWFGTVSGTDTYTASCSGTCTYTLTSGAPADGDVIELYIPNANLTTTPTLAITDANSVTSAAIPLSDFQGATEGLIGGTFTSGDIITFTFTSTTTCIPSTGTASFSYTVQPGDNGNNVVVGLQNQINVSAAMSNQPMAMFMRNSIGGGNFAFNYASNACALTFTHSVSGAATETIVYGNNTIGGITANTLYYLIYNKLLNRWISEVGPRASVPYSLQIKLANAVSIAAGVNVGCWLQASLIWSNASFMSLANYAAANPCPGGTWFEISNEVWNPGNPETGLSGNIAGSLGLYFSAVSYLQLRNIQLFSIAQTSFAGQLAKLHTVGAFQLGNISASALAGTGLCGTSCGNTAYQNAIGTDHNSGLVEPHNYYTSVSQAPYYNGSILSGAYGSPSNYGTFSATSSSVSANVLTVSGTVTSTIYPNQGISSCDGVYIAPPNSNDPSSAQLTGKVTTTLTAAIVRNQSTPILLTSSAGILPNMWMYDATTGILNGIVNTVNAGGPNQITLTTLAGSPPVTNFPSAGSNDTVVFGGLTGTYQLNNTSCSAASGTITGGDVLGLQYAADNYNGVGGALGSQQDGLNWVYQDAYNSVQKGVTATYATAHSIVDAANIANNVGGYGLPVTDYEGGFQALQPTGSQATGMGLPSTAYGDAGYVYKLLQAFKNSTLMKTLEVNRHALELAALPAGSSTCWYVFSSNGQWALFPGDLYSPPPYKSYDAIQQYN